MSIAQEYGAEARRLIDAAHALGPTIVGLRDQIQRERQLPAAFVDQLRDQGFFSLLLPRQLGGLELSLTDQGRVCGRAERSRQSAAPRLRHLRMVSALTP
jgi:alkylation response protein AidB-like acyl-CoA dehydrogenase